METENFAGALPALKGRHLSAMGAALRFAEGNKNVTIALIVLGI